jgi:hypothetical protein
MSGYKSFAAGERLFAADVNDFLMEQAVMTFADATARAAALSGVLREGILTYNEDTAQLEVYDGSAFVVAAPPSKAFNARAIITATNTSWPVPSLANPIVKVTVVGAGGGGGGGHRDTGSAGNGGNGGTTTFGVGAAFAVTASGGVGGSRGAATFTTPAQGGGLRSANGGMGGNVDDAAAARARGGTGYGGVINVAYVDLTGVSTVNVAIGAGGSGGTPLGIAVAGASGGRGEVIVEYKAA